MKKAYKFVRLFVKYAVWLVKRISRQRPLCSFKWWTLPTISQFHENVSCFWCCWILISLLASCHFLPIPNLLPSNFEFLIIIKKKSHWTIDRFDLIKKHILTKKPDWWKQWFIAHIYIFFALLRVSSVLNDLFKLSQFLIELKLFYQNKNHFNFGLNWRRASTGWILIHLNVPILVMRSLQRSTLSRFYKNC